MGNCDCNKSKRGVDFRMKRYILFILFILFLTACAPKEIETGAYVNTLGGNTAANITINGTNSYIQQRNITIDTRYIVDDAHFTIRGIP